MNQRSTSLRLILCAALLAVACGPRSARAADAGLKDGDYVGVIGDSITEQKLYSLFIEDYLLMCQPAERPARQPVRLGRRDVVGLQRPDEQRPDPVQGRPSPPPASA